MGGDKQHGTLKNRAKLKIHKTLSFNQCFQAPAVVLKTVIYMLAAQMEILNASSPGTSLITVQ